MARKRRTRVVESGAKKIRTEHRDPFLVEKVTVNKKHFKSFFHFRNDAPMPFFFLTPCPGVPGWTGQRPTGVSSLSVTNRHPELPPPRRDQEVRGPKGPPQGAQPEGEAEKEEGGGDGRRAPGEKVIIIIILACYFYTAVEVLNFHVLLHKFRNRPHLEEAETVVGDGVLDLDPGAEFNIHFPFRRGDLNLHPGVGASWSLQPNRTDQQKNHFFCVHNKF